MSYPYSGIEYRPSATGRACMVSSAHPLASIAGLRTLMEGGNAIDAAIAVASTIGAVEMGFSGIGGVGWMQIYHAATDTHTCLDFQGWSSHNATVDRYSGPETMQLGILAPLVPGCPAGWCAALERFGTMDRQSVFKYVIDICENGHPVTAHAASVVNTYLSWLQPFPESMKTFFPDRNPMRAGQLHKQPDLANTFRILAEDGPDAFYRGELADQIIAFMEAEGGIITRQDLDELDVQWVDSISVTYRDFEVHGPPPPSSAIQWLQTLKMLEGFDTQGMGHNSVDYLHTLIEVEKLAIADRVTYNVAPDAPVCALLSEEYCAERRALVDPARAAFISGARYATTMDMHIVKPGNPGHKESTTHFNVVDSEGNAVSCTQSLGGFGCGMVVPGTGILLNDFTWWFDRDPASPNVVAPHKKVEMCLSPGMIWKGGKIFACIGTPGSHGIMETTPQFMNNMMDFGMSVQAAIEAPRVRPQEMNRILAERRIPDEVCAGLTGRGHVVEQTPEFLMAMGGAQGIMIDPDTGTLSGGGDPRRDGYAVGW